MINTDRGNLTLVPAYFNGYRGRSCFDGKKDDVKRFEVFLDNVCRFIKRRSLFMAAMLWLEEFHGELYDSLMKGICIDKTINGYDSVFGCLLYDDRSIEVDRELVSELSEDERKLLDETYKRIKEI